MGDVMQAIERTVVYVEVPVTVTQVRAAYDQFKPSHRHESYQPGGVRLNIVLKEGELPMSPFEVRMRDGKPRNVLCPSQPGAEDMVGLAMQKRLDDLAGNLCEVLRSRNIEVRPVYALSVKEGKADSLVSFDDFKRMVDGAWQPDPMPDNPTDEQVDEREELTELARILAPARS